MRFLSAALLPLVLAACAPSSKLSDMTETGPSAADPAAARGFPSSVPLFPDYKARPVTGQGDWRELNRGQAPEGALP